VTLVPHPANLEPASSVTWTTNVTELELWLQSLLLAVKKIRLFAVVITSSTVIHARLMLLVFLLLMEVLALVLAQPILPTKKRRRRSIVIMTTIAEELDTWTTSLLPALQPIMLFVDATIKHTEMHAGLTMLVFL